MIVGICGIKRSGSTAMWNIVRIALKQAGYNVELYGHDYKPTPHDDNTVQLFKRHPFNKELAEKADHIFLTDRADDEILASLDRMWDSGDPERLKRMRRELDKWMQYDNSHYMHYRFFKNDPTFWIHRVLNVLDLYVNVRWQKVLEEFQTIEPPKDKQDPTTLLFPNHISE